MAAPGAGCPGSAAVANRVDQVVPVHVTPPLDPHLPRAVVELLLRSVLQPVGTGRGSGSCSRARRLLLATNRSLDIIMMEATALRGRCATRRATMATILGERLVEMERCRLIEHGGTTILLSDLSGIRSIPELQRTIRLGTELVQTRPLGSLLILVDLTDVEYSLEAFAIVQQSVAVNRPYVRARAIVGLPRAAIVPFEIVARISGSPMARFGDRESALAWLVGHAAPE